MLEVHMIYYNIHSYSMLYCVRSSQDLL